MNSLSSVGVAYYGSEYCHTTLPEFTVKKKTRVLSVAGKELEQDGITLDDKQTECLLLFT